jgi:Ala-tRNA(Pro) deacylase
MAIDARLEALLRESGVDYEVIPHREDYTAHTAAHDTDTPPHAFAKTVVVKIDDGYALAVLPADHFLAVRRLATTLGADEVRLLSEDEMAHLLPGCEVGAVPPFGELYGLDTYASDALVGDDRITFNAGTHREAVRMAWRDYQRLAQPRIEHLSRDEEERL